MGSAKVPATTRLAWVLSKALAFAASLLALSLLGAYAAIFHAHCRAQNLLLEVKSLQSGVTSVEHVKDLVKRYGGSEYDAHSYDAGAGGKRHAAPDPCLGDDLSHSIMVSPPVTFLRVVQRFPMLRAIGLHPWYVSVGIDHKDGKVTCYSERVTFFRPDGRVVQGSASLELRNTESLVEQQLYEAESFVSRNWYHNTRVTVLDEAPANEKARAFQMNLSCTGSLRGCVLPCQIIPLGWLDSVRDSQSHGRDLPEGADDPRCPAH